MSTYPDFTEHTNAVTKKIRPTFFDKQKHPFLRMPFACSVCEKAPDDITGIILEAFSTLSKYKLVLAADWNSTQKAAALYKKYSATSNIVLLDKQDLQKDMRLIVENCFVYIHGTGGNSIAPLSCAMLAGQPVIAYNDGENTNLTSGKAFYYEGSREIKKIILEKTIADFKAIGKQMYQAAQAILLQPA